MEIGTLMRGPLWGSGFLLFEFLFSRFLDRLEIVGIRRERFGSAAGMIEGIISLMGNVTSCRRG